MTDIRESDAVLQLAGHIEPEVVQHVEYSRSNADAVGSLEAGKDPLLGEAMLHMVGFEGTRKVVVLEGLHSNR